MLSKLFVCVLAWFQGEEGQDLIEYALITAALSLGIIVIITGAGIPGQFSGWATRVINAINA